MESNVRDFIRAATTSLGEPDSGVRPYAYQVRIALEGLPEFLQVPTGSGKTMAAVLPWLFRRRVHSDGDVRAGTPGRLVLVLPQRSLVMQTLGKVREWLANLERLDLDGGWDQVQAHVLMGGVSSDDRAWKLNPAADAIFVGTQDMILSRLLMRGYGEARSAWPMSFGFLHCGTQFVFDEIQLMGPGLGTSIQLEGLRRLLGVAAPSETMWMSATFHQDRVDGFPDLPDLATTARRIGLSGDDESGPLATRLNARRTVRELAVHVPAAKYADAVAAHALSVHQAGTRTIVIVNTVQRAQAVYAAVTKRTAKGERHPVGVLLHSRYRPADRDQHTDLALQDPGPTGSLIISSQVLEAGVDVSSRVMVTEVAAWSSIVQRAGRCNRGGESPVADLWWVQPPGRDGHRPYEDLDVKASIQRLQELEGLSVTSRQLQGAPVQETAPIHPVLRRRDLLSLFDTSADLNGNDVDVSRWIRDGDERTVSVAWRELGGDRPAEDASAPHRDELCAAPIAELRELLKRHRDGAGAKLGRAWVRAQPSGQWVAAEPEQIRPGAIVVLDSAAGGYSSDRGWDPTSNARVEPVRIEEQEWALASASSACIQDEDTPGESTAQAALAVSLTQHLGDVGRQVEELLTRWPALPGLSGQQRAAAVQAGYLHDLGKAHPGYVAAIREVMGERAGSPDRVWAKSGVQGQLRVRRLAKPAIPASADESSTSDETGRRRVRSRLRHELVTAVMLLDPGAGLLDGIGEPDLTVFLAAAHHGKVRLSVRPAPDEDEGLVLGVATGDVTVPLDLPDGRHVPSLSLSTAAFGIGTTEGGRSWTERACALRDRVDLGPFRIAFLEAVVRSGDWQVSAGYDEHKETR